MKIITVVGTRPEIIRCSEIIKKLDKVCEHILVDTNQNSHDNLSGIFYRELGIREPDYMVGTDVTSIGHQIGTNFVAIEKIIEKEKPDKAFCPCDTNTSLVAFIFERNNIPVYHLEAGNRCFDRTIAEETNRKTIDAISSFNLPYTEHSKENLLDDGIKKNKIFVAGNPICEIILVHNKKIDDSQILEKLGIKNEDFILVTCHRQETVDHPKRFQEIFKALNRVAKDYLIVYPMHPRARQKLNKFGIQVSKNIIIIEPLGFFDLIKLEKNAILVMTDSGTIQEEACIVGTPAIILRMVTERPETVECGASVIGGVKGDEIIGAYEYMKKRLCSRWIVPKEYLYIDVSDRVVTFMMSKQYEDMK
jgi:UDP-N-acetylglucosamine 2-epimerase (non-hydrolysing)